MLNQVAHPGASSAMPLPFHAEELFETIQSAVGHLREAHETEFLFGERLAEQFSASLAAAEVVSFDIFDTLIVRSVAFPADVFLFLKDHPSFQLFDWKHPLPQLRSAAEHRARQAKSRECGTGEVTLSEIYAAFCELTSVPADRAKTFVEAEEAIELGLCRPNPAILRLFQHAVAAGKPVIAISDTYHHQAFIVRLLASAGLSIVPQHVYVSSELRVNKQGGQLFSHVFRHRQLKAHHLLHVGDHQISDNRTPRQMGVSTLLHGHHVSSESPRPFISASAAPLQTQVRAACSYGLRCEERAGDFWWSLGYSTFGPVISGFAAWLRDQFVQDEIDRAYFLLRDGEIFLKVYETLFSESRPKPQLLHASRRAFVLPLLSASPDYAVQSLIAGIGERPAGEYLHRLGISTEGLEDEFHAAEIPSPDALIDARHDARIVKLLRRPRVWKRLLEGSLSEKACLLRYLQQEGVFEPGRVALIDLGWNGTIQKAVHLLMTEARLQPNFAGYYLATLRSFGDFLPGNLIVKSYLAHLGDPLSIASVLCEFRELLDIVCSNTNGSLVGFDYVKSRMQPRLLPNPTPPDHHAKLKAIHGGLVAFAAAFRQEKGMDTYEGIPAAIAAENLLRLIGRPTKQEAQQIGSLVHCDDMGSARARPAAQFRQNSFTPEELMHDYQSSYWKVGLLNRPDPKAMMLRTIMWLKED